MSKGRAVICVGASPWQAQQQTQKEPSNRVRTLPFPVALAQGLTRAASGPSEPVLWGPFDLGHALESVCSKMSA